MRYREKQSFESVLNGKTQLNFVQRLENIDINMDPWRN